MRWLFSGIVLMLLSACATHPPAWEAQVNPDQARLWKKHLKSVQALDQWQAQGRFAAHNGGDAWSGSIVWQQKDEHYLIRLSGPLGQGAILLEGDASLATITFSRDKQFQADSANELIRQHAGLRLPLEEMQHWLIGAPAPWGGYAIRVLNPQGRIEKFTQRGWNVEYSNYQSVSNTALPQKIRLQHPEYQVRLVIRNWQAEG